MARFWRAKVFEFSRSFVASSPGTIENVLRGLLDSLAFIHNPANKAQVMKSLAKGLRLRRVEDAEDGIRSCSESTRKDLS
jgi:ABC-type nitrate/sulfonate/bicarbonate transport system substrate-binding protein